MQPAADVIRDRRQAFYAAALVGLRALDSRERTPRRFGPDADTRWSQFRGALGTADRLDVLLRDAASTWGAAFSPALAFGLPGLAEDEPFGPDWKGLDDHLAQGLWSGSSAANLEDAARALGVVPSPVELPHLGATTRVIVAGGAALLAVAQRFAQNPGWSWTDQVLTVASRPESRQLAALAAVTLGARGRTALVQPADDVAATLRSAGFAQVDAAVTSPDASAASLEFAKRAVGGR